MHETDLVVDSERGRLYFCGLDSVVSVSLDTHARLARLIDLDQPGALALDTDRDRLFVANYSGNTVSVVDRNTFTVTNTLTVGTSPHAICYAPSANHLFVANRSSTQPMHVFDATTLARVSFPGKSVYRYGRLIIRP